MMEELHPAGNFTKVGNWFTTTNEDGDELIFITILVKHLRRVWAWELEADERGIDFESAQNSSDDQWIVIDLRQWFRYVDDYIFYRDMGIEI